MRQGNLCPRRASAARPIVFLVLLFAIQAGHAATGGNDFYTLRVEDDPNEFGIGLYTVATGPSHPVTGALGPKDVLFGGTLRPGQSFTTIRSWTSGTDYLQNTGVLLTASAPPTMQLEGFVASGEEAVPIGDPNNPSGFVTTYRIGTVAAAPDILTVVQTVEAVGATFNDSAVRIQTAITNDGSATVDLGIRYLWDFRIGFDDGPTYRELDPNGPVQIAEISTLAPAFGTYGIVDNNKAASCFSGVNPTVPFFEVQGSVTGPAALSPTPPTRLDFVAWPLISGLSGLITPAVPQPSAFDYTNGGMDATTCDISLDDSGVAYWWGDEPSSALAVPAGETVTISAYIFGYLPGIPPTFPPPTGEEGPPGDPTCEDGFDNDGDGLIDLDDPDCVPPAEGPYGDPTCEDGIDNDDDGLTDGDDPDCMPPNEPPDCSGAAPTLDELWPPNHKYRHVGIEGITDPDGDPVEITVVAIAQDEPLNAKGDGNTCPDADGVGTDSVVLRAERSGRRDGRVYHIAFDAEDDAGGICSGIVTVCVPHDKGKKKVPCVDQGPLFDSMGSCGVTAADCVTRTKQFFGASRKGSDIIDANGDRSLNLHPQDPLRSVFPEGRLLPLQLGSGAFTFHNRESIAGSSLKGVADGGFLPGKGKGRDRQGAKNLLPNETLTLALNTGLSIVGADALASMDLDGDGVPDPVRFQPQLLGLVVDWPGRMGDLMTVEEVLRIADEALLNGAGFAKPNEPLARYLNLQPGKTYERGGTVSDLITLVSKVNAACGSPRKKSTGFLMMP